MDIQVQLTNEELVEVRAAQRTFEVGGSIHTLAISIAC